MNDTKINSIDVLRQLFGEIDSRLRTPLKVYAIGGANLIWQGISRPTEDVDVIFPEHFSDEMAWAIQKIGEKHGLGAAWMNTKPAHYKQYLPKGWKRRAIKIFEGEYLHVFALGRREMVGLKMIATLERFEDWKDLLAMKPTVQEIELARQWARNYPANPGWKEVIDQLAKKLTREV